MQENVEEKFVIDSPVGKLKIQMQLGSLQLVEFSSNESLKSSNDLQVAKSDKALSLVKQLSDYFSFPSNEFKVELLEQGSDFQKRVWQALRQIPVGQILTYGQLAKQLNSSARAVGNACRRNPTPIIVPCHRIVAANGLGGFAGSVQGRLPAVKQWLLRHEQAHLTESFSLV